MRNLVIALLGALAVAHASAGDVDSNIGVENKAGAYSNSTNNFFGGQSPVIGLPGLPQPASPQLLGQLPPPYYLLFRQLSEMTLQFGDMEVGSKEDVAQFTTDGKEASVTFATSPQFGKYRKVANENRGNLTAKFTARWSGRVNWLGNVIVSSKNGVVMLPPADKGFVWEAIANASSGNLSRVIVVPVPHGFGVNVGIATDGSSFGLSTTFAKLLSIFVGIGPSASMQSGTTMPTGEWAQQYLVFEEDPNGIPFQIDMVTPREPEAKAPPPPSIDHVALARERAVAQAKEIAEQMERMQKARLALEVTVPMERVVFDQKPCVMQEFTNSAGEKVTMCPGSKSGSYRSPRIVKEVVKGNAETTFGSQEVKK